MGSSARGHAEPGESRNRRCVTPGVTGTRGAALRVLDVIRCSMSSGAHGLCSPGLSAARRRTRTPTTTATRSGRELSMSACAAASPSASYLAPPYERARALALAATAGASSHASDYRTLIQCGEWAISGTITTSPNAGCHRGDVVTACSRAPASPRRRARPRSRGVRISDIIVMAVAPRRSLARDGERSLCPPPRSLRNLRR